MKAINLESERLLYQPLSLKHLSQKYVDWLNDTDVIRYLESGGNYSIEALKAFLQEQEKKDILFWAILIKGENLHIGNIKIDPIDSTDRSGEYGIMMGDKDQWGKGYAKEASIRIIEHCFKDLRLSKITLGVVDKNMTALNLYKKIGFEKASVISDYGVYEGQMCNSIRMVKYNDG